MSIRKFDEASDLFLETVNTFMSYEILDYETFIRYTVLTAMVALPRKLLKEKIVHNPDILCSLHSDKQMHSYIFSLFNCQYGDFFQKLGEVELLLKCDMFLNPHYRFYIREMKNKAYCQILSSYNCLSLEFMADSFGVSVDYIDNDLSKFIAAGKICCKIDKVGGVVVTSRAGFKNSEFQQIVKHGDFLLNRVQKLSRVINI